MTELASQVGLSERRMEMIFRENLGQSPSAYYRRLRLTKARRMVLDSQKSFQEIAIRCGFNSQAAFSRAFTREFGGPPSSLRKLDKR